jgi:Transcriptional regulator SbtR-like, C-terminal domain
VLPLMRRMFDNAQAAGSVRVDAAFTDFLVLMRAMRGVVDFTERIAPGAWHRQLDMIFDGLRPGVSTSPLKPEALDSETYRRAVTAQSS